MLRLTGRRGIPHPASAFHLACIFLRSAADGETGDKGQRKGYTLPSLQGLANSLQQTKGGEEMHPRQLLSKPRKAWITVTEL